MALAEIQLVPDGTLLLHLLMVGVMIFVLNRTLLKPINQILSEREKQITGRLREAQMLKAETEEKLRQYKEGLHGARSEGYRLLEKERAEGLREKEEAIRRYREDMSRDVAAQLEITRKQEETVKSELESQAVTISSLISAQILRRPSR